MIVERADAHVAGRDLQEQGAALVLARRDPLDGGLDGVGELLLSTGDGALRGLGGGDELVDIHADRPDAGVAGSLQHAVAGLAGDLEEDVDIGILGQQLLRQGLATGRVVERGRVRGARSVGHGDDRVGVDRQGALRVALDVVHDGRDDRGATDGGDVAGLTDVGSDDAGEVAGLLLAPVQALQVRQELSSVAFAAESGVRIALCGDAGGLVHADELDVGAGLGRGDGVEARGEADGHDDVVLLVDEGLDVRRDVDGLLADGVLRLSGANGLGAGDGTFPAVLVEVAVVDGSDVRHEADLQIGAILRQRECAAGE